MATYADLQEFLLTVPAAPACWVEPLFVAGLSMDAVRVFFRTMAADDRSALREAENGVLSAEIVRMNAGMGEPGVGPGNGRLRVSLRGVLSVAERARVIRLVGHFCQPAFDSKNKFSKSDHTVMRVARRAVSAYLYGKAGVGDRLLEVGPDVNHFITGTDNKGFVDRVAEYKGARPSMKPRDVVRMQWKQLLSRVMSGKVPYSDETVKRAGLVASGVMHNKKVEEMMGPVDGIISVDSNYDIEFSMMPGVMARTGAKWWYGCMCRAKGLTAYSRLTRGSLELCGTTWCVDWPNDRIDFRHPSCNAFGYSHKVSSYMRYEEANGYVWSAPDAQYVYSKGPETNDELLFFSVHRVQYPMAIREPVFAPHPHAGRMRLSSLWAVGDEVNGVPSSFQQVEFHVDPLSFSKLYERRALLGHSGDLASTISLIRSTNVIFFLNGTPVGAGSKVASRLSEATALVVEAMCNEQRRENNAVYDRAWRQFEIEVQRDGWLVRMLEAMVDLRAVVGTIVSSFTRVWQTVRTPLLNAAVADISKFKVSAVMEDVIVKVPDGSGTGKAPQSLKYAGCFCEEKAVLISKEKTLPILDELRLRELRAMECGCRDVTDAIIAVGKTVESGVVEEDSGSDSAEVSSVFDEVGDAAEETEDSSLEDDLPEEIVEHLPAGVAEWSSAPNSVELAAMEEVILISKLQVQTVLSECKVDAAKIVSGGVTKRNVANFQTLRSRHAFIRFEHGRSAEFIGELDEDVSAVFDYNNGSIIPVQRRAGVYTAVSKEARLYGWYYTCNRLRVWNHSEVSSAVQLAIDMGVPSLRRSMYQITLGVPGAGKTYAAMEMVAPLLKSNPGSVLYLAVTKASVKAAIVEATSRGVMKSIAEQRCMTLDSYLINKKCRTSVLVMDEGPSDHIGKMDAAAVLSGASYVHIYGDAEQILYDTYIAGFQCKFACPGMTVPEENYKFMEITHRCPEDVCAAWLHVYPGFFPCSCHGVDKDRPTMFYRRIKNVKEVVYDRATRYHGYRQEDKEEIRSNLPFGKKPDELRADSVGGLATVHEDQGTTRSKVCTVRPFADYDKHQAKSNPSLFNKQPYVLSDTTRHTERYDYETACAETDEVIRAVERGRDPVRLAMVRERKAMKNISLQTLWM